MVRIGILLLALFLEACGEPELVRYVPLDAETELAAAAVIRLDEDDRNPVVTVEIVGVGPARMMVDTGAEVTTLDAAFARRHDLPLRPYRGTVNADKPDRSSIRVDWVAEVERLEVGGAIARDLDLLVIDLSHIERGYDGILGMDILGDWAVLFDAARRELHLVPGDAVEHLATLFPEGTGFYCLPLEDGVRLPRLGFKVEGEPGLRMLIDTGATFSALPVDVVDALALPTEAIARVWDVAGVGERKVCRIEDFSLGPWTISMRVTELKGGDRGLLGYEALKEFVFLVDTPRHRLLLAHRPDRLDEP